MSQVKLRCAYIAERIEWNESETSVSCVCMCVHLYPKKRIWYSNEPVLSWITQINNNLINFPSLNIRVYVK